jgi:hypothetical protein
VSWTEVNIFPPAGGDPERLLLDIVDPLVHRTLAGQWEAWFFFWECDAGRDRVGDHLRLRILWQDRRSRELAAILDDAVTAGTVDCWHEGNHGVKGEQYEGEANGYGGQEAWEATIRHWTTGSELALTILRQEAQGLITKSRSYAWRRDAHLSANWLGLDDVKMCLMQGQRYLELRMERAGADPDPYAVTAVAAIDRYLYGERPGEAL